MSEDEYLSASVATSVTQMDEEYNWSQLPKHLQKAAREFTLAASKANAILEFADQERALVLAGMCPSDPKLTETLRGAFGELLESSLNWMHTCLLDEDRRGVTFDHALDFEDLKRRQRILAREDLSATELAVGLHMFLIAVSVIRSEESPFISMRQATRTGKSIIWKEEIRNIINEIQSKKFEDVIARIELQAGAEAKVWVEVERDEKVVHYFTRGHVMSKTSFKQIKRYLGELRVTGNSHI